MDRSCASMHPRHSCIHTRQMDIQIIPGFPCPSPYWGQPTAVQNRSRRFYQRAAKALDQRGCAGFCCGFCIARFLGQMRGKRYFPVPRVNSDTSEFA